MYVHALCFVDILTYVGTYVRIMFKDAVPMQCLIGLDFYVFMFVCIFFPP